MTNSNYMYNRKQVLVQGQLFNGKTVTRIFKSEKAIYNFLSREYRKYDTSKKQDKTYPTFEVYASGLDEDAGTRISTIG